MTRILRGFLWLALVGLCLLAPSAWAVPDSPPFGVYQNTAFSPTITVLESDSVIRLDLDMAHLPQSGSINFATRFAGTWGEMNPTGVRVPRFTIYVALPPHGNPVLTTESWVDTVYQAAPYYISENANPPARIRMDSTNVGILGGVRVIPITFRPVYYHNNADTCQVLRHAVIAIRMDSTNGRNPVDNPPVAFSRPWQRMYQTIVTNWEYIPHIYDGANSHILMIVPDQGTTNYIPWIQKFVRWKEQRGIKVTIVPKSTLGTNPTADNVRTRIISELGTSDPRIDYVILVGDETRLPVSMLNTPDPISMFSTFSYPGQYTNELYFSAVQGTDVFPDVFVGRWIVNSAVDVQKYVSRILMHERDTFLSDSLRFQKATVAADVQTLSQPATKRRCRQMMMAHGYTTVDTIFGHGNSQTLINRINQGRSFVNYRGQGWYDEWYGIDFYVSDIPSIDNTRKLPIVTGIGCGGGIFNLAQDDACFGELFMLSGTITDPKGAAGFVGPCWNTHTVFNDVLDSSLYRGWFDYGNLEVSPGLAVGKMMLWAILHGYLNDANVLEVTQTAMRQYHVEGDPSLQVFTHMPTRLQVTMPDTIPYGTQTEFSVAVTNMNSVDAESLNVTLWLNDSTSQIYWMRPDQPNVTVLAQPLSTDTVTVTITGDNVLAYQKVLHTEGPNSAGEKRPEVPQSVELAQNFPNPFNPETAIEFALPKQDFVRLDVFNVLGRRVATLVQGMQSSGRHRIIWASQMDDGTVATSGVYYCRLTTSDATLTRKMLLMR